MTSPAYGFLHRGTAVAYDADVDGWTVRITALSPGRTMGPFPTMAAGVQEGERVVLASIGTSRDDLIILGRVPTEFPDIGDIPGLVAALAGKADDSEITAILAELVVQDGRLDTHDTHFTTVDGRLDGHDTLLTSHTGTLSSYGTRLTTQEAKVGYVLPVANAAARPVTGLYNGYPIYRQDKAFIEIYNGSGSWRLRQFSLVAALADVDFPVGGQLVVLATDLMIYVYNATSTSWVGVKHTVAGGGHARYRLASGHPNIAASTVTKVAFNTAESTTTDVTQSVDKKEFTLVRGGTWFLSCKLPFSGGVSGGASRFAWIAPASDDTIRYAGGSTPPSSFIMVPGGSDTVQLPAGTVLSVYAYQDSAVALGFDITGMQGNFTARWEGP